MTNHFKNIFDQFYSPLCNYAAAIIHDENTAEDIVQAFFIQLWEKKQLSNVRNTEAFLLKCIKFKCIDYLRAKKKNREVLMEELPPNSEFFYSEIKEEDIEPLLHFFAAKLPPKTRAVFLMSRQKGMTYKEIALELQVSQKTVENQMSNALKKMRILLKKHQLLSLLPFL